MAANGHSHPPTLSHTGPRNTWSDGTSSHVWHHQATLRNRLILKQVLAHQHQSELIAIARATMTSDRLAHHADTKTLNRDLIPDDGATGDQDPQNRADPRESSYAEPDSLGRATTHHARSYAE